MPQHFLDRLERRLHFLAIPGLASLLVGMNAIVWIMTMLRPEFPSRLVLYPDAVWAGQAWRVLTCGSCRPRTGNASWFFWLHQ